MMPVALAVLFLTLAGSPTYSQDRDLQLSIRVIDEQICSVSTTTDSLRLMLKLRYTNMGGRRLIVYKGNRFFYQVFVNRSAADRTARKTEFRMSHARYYDAKPEKIVGNAPSGVFTTLSPGESYETTRSISLPVARSGEGNVNVSIGAGEHWIHVVSSTWYESGNLGQTLRERWRGRGFLWTEPVASESIGFVVGSRPATTVCR